MSWFGHGKVKVPAYATVEATEHRYKTNPNTCSTWPDVSPVKKNVPTVNVHLRHIRQAVVVEIGGLPITESVNPSKHPQPLRASHLTSTTITYGAFSDV